MKSKIMVLLITAVLLVGMVFPAGAVYASEVPLTERANAESEETLLEQQENPEEETLFEQERTENEEALLEQGNEEAVVELSEESAEELQQDQAVFQNEERIPAVSAQESVSAPVCTYTKEEAIAAADAVTGDHLINIKKESGDQYYAENGNGEALALPTDYMDRLVQSVLAWIKENDDGNFYRVVIPKGTYTLDHISGWNIYSNTIIDCRSGAKIYCGNTAIIIRAGRNDDASSGVIADPGGYDDYRNMMLLGGTWSGVDGVYGGNIRFSHCSNLYLLDMVIRDNYGSKPDEPQVRGHHVEIGGASGVLISGCEITGSHGESGETIQIEVVHRNVDNCSGYAPYDDLPTCNMTVENCNFHDIFRGVGSHHVVLGHPFQNIKIINNTFTNVSDRAVLAAYCKNMTISGNEITNAFAGIQSYSIFRRHTYYANGVTSGEVEDFASGLKITDNTILLNAKSTPANSSDADSYKFGIRVDGGEITESTAVYTEKITHGYSYDSPVSVTKTLPVGHYYHTNVTIKDNVVGVYKATSVTNGNINAGISTDHLKNSVISGNRIDLNDCEQESGFGMDLKDSHKLTIENNEIRNVSGAENGDGIYARLGSKNITISNNIIEKVSAFGIVFAGSSRGSVLNNRVDDSNVGIYIRDGSAASEVKDNIVKNCSANGIAFASASGGDVTGNKITNTVNFGIDLRTAKVTNISGNTIVKAATDKQSAAIRLAAGSECTSVNDNHIDGRSVTMYGIRVVESTADEILRNVFENMKSDGFGILVQKNAAVTSVMNNKMAGSGKDIVKVAADASVKTNKNNVFAPVLLSLNKTKAEIPTLGTLQLKAEVLPSSAGDGMKWKSSKTAVCTVDQNGLVTAKTYGKATITATLSDGTKATCAIQTRFYDVNDPSVSYFKPVYWAADNKITGNTVNFLPEDAVTRGQFVTFLWKMAGKPAGNMKLLDKFSDVNSSTTGSSAIAWAIQKGIIAGYSDGTFRPSETVIRRQVAIMLWKWQGKPSVSAQSSPFSDVKKSDTCYKAVLWGSSKGIIGGYPDGTFKPAGKCKRQHVVTFLYRYAK